MTALNAFGIVSKPVPSYPGRPAPAGSSEAGSSEMHSRMAAAYAGNHRPASPAYYGSGGSPEQQLFVQPALSAEILQLLTDNPEELQRLLSLKNKSKTKKSD